MTKPEYVLRVFKVPLRMQTQLKAFPRQCSADSMEAPTIPRNGRLDEFVGSADWGSLLFVWEEAQTIGTASADGIQWNPMVSGCIFASTRRLAQLPAG